MNEKRWNSFGAAASARRGAGLQDRRGAAAGGLLGLRRRGGVLLHGPRRGGVLLHSAAGGGAACWLGVLRRDAPGRQECRHREHRKSHGSPTLHDPRLQIPGGFSIRVNSGPRMLMGHRDSRRVLDDHLPDRSSCREYVNEGADRIDARSRPRGPASRPDRRGRPALDRAAGSLQALCRLAITVMNPTAGPARAVRVDDPSPGRPIESDGPTRARRGRHHPRPRRRPDHAPSPRIPAKSRDPQRTNPAISPAIKPDNPPSG